VRNIHSSIGRRRTRGSALIEFALCATVFFTVLCGILDFGYLCYVNLTMQHAVREGARVASVGRQDLDPNPTPGNPMQNRYDTLIAQMQAQSMGLWTQVSPVVSISVIDAGGAVVGLPANNVGTATQIIVVSVDCTVPVLTGFTRVFFTGGNYTFRVSTTIRNEAFS
jgi:Flp pilus assembly protein TadG